jgi:hypothetical protein
MAMNALRFLAIALSLSLMIGEAWRSWGAGRPVMFVMDDMLIGGFLIAAAIAVREDNLRNRAAFAAAWGTAAGMLYPSFFGKVFAPETVEAGNWDLGVLTILVGAAFIVSLAGMWLSITLPSTARSLGSPPEK